MVMLDSARVRPSWGNVARPAGLVASRAAAGRPVEVSVFEGTELKASASGRTACAPWT